MSQASQLIAEQFRMEQLRLRNGESVSSFWGNLIYNVKVFGAKGDGIHDDTNAIQIVLNLVSQYGGVLYLPPGNYKITNPLTKTSDIKVPFSIVGSGIGQTTITRGTNYNGSIINIGNANDIMVRDISLNGNHDIYSNGNHGLVMFNGSNLRAIRVSVEKCKNTSIIMYGSTAGNSFRNCVIDDCYVDGNNAAGNGLLIANLSYSGIRNCHVKNLGQGGSPGYGLQLKNDCSFCFIADSYVENAAVGIAFGNDDGTLTVRDSIVSNVRVYNCVIGIATGYCRRNLFNGILIDMNNGGGAAIDLQLDSVGNAITDTVIKNILTPSKSAVRIRSGCNDNVVDILNISNDNGFSGIVAEFNSGSLRNTITLKRMASPTTVNNSESLIADATVGSTNIFIYEPLANKQASSITSDSITVKNAKITRIKVDTEASAAADNLATINGGVDGQIITLQQTANARVVTVKHNTGNIRLNGGTDCVLTTAYRTLTLVYDSSISAWVEVSRGTAS